MNSFNFLQEIKLNWELNSETLLLPFISSYSPLSHPSPINLDSICQSSQYTNIGTRVITGAFQEKVKQVYRNVGHGVDVGDTGP
jgi:hypothetical protein